MPSDFLGDEFTFTPEHSLFATMQHGFMRWFFHENFFLFCITYVLILVSGGRCLGDRSSGAFV